MSKAIRELGALDEKDSLKTGRSQYRNLDWHKILRGLPSLIAVAAGLGLALMSFLRVKPLKPLGYMLASYKLNHWAAWLAMAFIVIYVPVFIVQKKRAPERYHLLLRIHEIGFIAAFITVSLHVGLQIREVFPPEIGTGVALYVVLLVLVVTGIIQRYQILPARASSVRFVHLSMVDSFFLIIVFHVLRALFMIGNIKW